MAEHFEWMSEVQEDCEHLVLDGENTPNCSYHDSSVGVCNPRNCPKWGGEGED